MSDSIIIVGAPRSGTNMLRDVLTNLPGMATWPCDEINLMWKHHHRDIPSDELTPKQATPEVRTYIRKRFERISRKFDAHTVVEKTCATSLRVAFAAEIFPEAKFVFIRRDGVDAAASAMHRWDAPFDLAYVAKKLRYSPYSDLPFYAGQFVAKRLASKRARRAFPRDVLAPRMADSWWGPRPHDFRELLAQHPLDELAAVQWQRCVESSLTDFKSIPADQVHEVVYEDFVNNPSSELGLILKFLGREALMDETALRHVSNASIGTGRVDLGEETVARLTALIGPTLDKLGYA